MNITIIRNPAHNVSANTYTGPAVLWEGELSIVPNVGDTIVLVGNDDGEEFEYTVEDLSHHPHPATPSIIIGVSCA
jgi:hypothetical protein